MRDLTVSTLTKAEARAMTEQIRTAAENLFDLAAEAYLGRVWLALGYESWDDYLNGELAGVRLQLPREERAEKVASLRERGLSLRAIAAVTGTTHPTVIEDLKSVGRNLPPDPQSVQGSDGKTYTPKADPLATLIAEYPEATELPKRARAEAIAGHQALSSLPETERPRREEIFTRWIRSEIEAGDNPPQDMTRYAARLAEDAATTLARVSVVATRLAENADHFHGIDADWSDLLGSARSAIDVIESAVTPTTTLRRIQ